MLVVFQFATVDQLSPLRSRPINKGGALSQARDLFLMNRPILPHLLWMSGLAFVLIGFALGPGVPYQDPTPEMHIMQARQERRCRVVALTGLALFIGGVVWGSSRRLTPSPSRNTKL
jgi:hypothetical protein